MQPRMDLQILGDGLHTFANAVANDQKEETSTTQICGEHVIELDFVKVRISNPNQIY